MKLTLSAASALRSGIVGAVMVGFLLATTAAALPSTAAPASAPVAVGGLEAALPAASADDVTWTVRTASNEYGTTRTSFDYTVDPGGTVSDAMIVANRGTDDLELGVYAADGYTTEDGQFDLVLSGDRPVAVGAWVAADSDRVTIAAGETAEVPFTVAVPDDATPGDYAGGIVTSLTQADETAGFNVDRRLGIRISLRVGGELAPSLALENVHVTWGGSLNPLAGGEAALSYTIHNTGNAVLSARQTAAAAGPFGWFPHTADAANEPPQLLPGESWPMTVSVRDVPGTFWFSATANVTPLVVDAAGSTTPLDDVTATATGSAVPWMLLGLLVLVAGVVTAIVLLTRRRRAQRKSRQDALVEEAVRDALARAGAE